MQASARAPSLAILLLAYGGPERLEDVGPFLLDIRGGRPTSPELVEEIRSCGALALATGDLKSSLLVRDALPKDIDPADLLIGPGDPQWIW